MLFYGSYISNAGLKLKHLLFIYILSYFDPITTVNAILHIVTKCSKEIFYVDFN
jgi:hypothetical protein